MDSTRKTYTEEELLSLLPTKHNQVSISTKTNGIHVNLCIVPGRIRIMCHFRGPRLRSCPVVEESRPRRSPTTISSLS
jgi:hypothetical protein